MWRTHWSQDNNSFHIVIKAWLSYMSPQYHTLTHQPQPETCCLIVYSLVLTPSKYQVVLNSFFCQRIMPNSRYDWSKHLILGKVLPVSIQRNHKSNHFFNACFVNCLPCSWHIMLDSDEAVNQCSCMTFTWKPFSLLVIVSTKQRVSTSIPLTRSVFYYCESFH